MIRPNGLIEFSIFGVILMSKHEDANTKFTVLSRRDLLKTVLYTSPVVLLGCKGAFEGNLG